MADNIKDLTLETPTDEVKTDEVKTDEIETVSKDTVEVEETAKTGLLGATANSTGDVPATSFTTKTAPDGTDNLILFNQNTNVGYQIDYDNLADAILNKITSKTFSNQVGGSSAATLLAQLSTLNSNFSQGAIVSENQHIDITGRSSRAYIHVMSTTSTATALYQVLFTSAGTAYLSPIKAPTSGVLSVTTNGGTVSVNNIATYSYNLFVYITTVSGDAPTFEVS